MDDSTLVLDLIGVYDNLHDRKPWWNETPAITGLTVSFLAVTWLCVVFRIYTRLIIIHSPGWDDVFVVLFLISGTACSLSVLLASKHGFGVHFFTLAPDDMKMFSKFLWLWNATYCMSTAFIKLSLLFQYLRVFKDRGASRGLCIILIAVTALWGTAYSFIAWFPCFPVRDDPDPFSDQCYGFYSAKAMIFYRTYLSHSASNMALDLMVLLTPLPIYFQAGTLRKTKLGLLILFGMGALVAFVSIMRLVTIVKHRVVTYPTLDASWYGTSTCILAVLEVDVASICASIPIFWPILTAKFDAIFVTREVTIERSDRYATMTDGQFELGDAAQHFSYRKETSEVSLTSLTCGEDMPSGNRTHYMDTFVASQVDPFSRTYTVEAEVTVPRPTRKG